MHHFLATVCSVMLALAPHAPAAPAVDADALQQLQRNFENLHRSIQNRGGISAEDAPVIERLRDRFAAFNAEHDGNLEAIAGELQLSVWIEDHDRVNALFERLLVLDPERSDVGHAWADYFSRLNQSDRVDEIYDQVLRISPDSRDIRVTRARRLRQQNQFPRALRILDELSPTDAEDPEVVLLRSECLFAENRFEEAVAILRAIPEETLDAQPRVRTQVEQALSTREAYIELWAQEQAIREAEATAELPQAEIIVVDRGRIVVELFEDNAPNTVANFITLAEDGLYDETTFHRVIANFMAQGGDPNTKPDATGVPGRGGPGYAIADEWQRDDARKHFAGTLAMANSGPNTAGSQFYITHQPVAHLNQGYTVFGRVLEGLDVVRAIQRDDRIESIRILRKRDHDYEVAQFTGAADPSRPEIPDDMPAELRERIQRILEESEENPGE